MAQRKPAISTGESTKKARILRVFCCSLCVLGRLEAPKARVLRVFCGLEAKKARVLQVFCGLEAPGRSKGVPGRAWVVQRCAQEAPLKEGWKHVEARMSLG